MPTSLPFLTKLQPTAETAKALSYLYQFDMHKDVGGGLAYEKELRACKLDYSLASIQRIDNFLSVRATDIQHDNDILDRFCNDRHPVHTIHYNLIILIGYYIGELIGRNRQRAPIWHTYDSFLDVYPHYEDELVDDVAHSIIMHYDYSADDLMNDEAEPKVSFFCPLVAVMSVLTGTDTQASIWNSVVELLVDSDNLKKKYHTKLRTQLFFDKKAAYAELDTIDLSYLQVIPPQWMHGDELFDQIRKLSHLYKDGKVVWGCIVQANRQLFDTDTPSACPAEVLFDPTGRTDVDTLQNIASDLFALKNTKPDLPELRRYAEHITDEYSRNICYPVPDAISPLPLFTSGMFFWRIHLPNGILSRPFPILVSETSREATPLPALFWDREYYQYWLNSSYESCDTYEEYRYLYQNEEIIQLNFSKRYPSMRQLHDIQKALVGKGHKTKICEPLDEEKRMPTSGDNFTKVALITAYESSAVPEQESKSSEKNPYNIIYFFIAIWVFMVLVRTCSNL